MRPLQDVRVVSIEQFGAGPFASLQLADLGAEVIKIEDPRNGGDVGRYVPPFRSGDGSLFFESFNRNKRSICLDLSVPAGRKVFEDLVARSDALFSNLRGDVPERLRIRYADLEDVNPRLVCCCLSGFGMDGPRRSEPAYDYILQGLAGWMSLTGEPDGPPAKSGLSLVDYCGGLVAALAIVVGIHAARRDGVGRDCDVSLFDTAIAMLTYPATWYLTAGHRAERIERSSHPSIVPFGNFPTRDGWIVIACAKQKFFVSLADALGRPELASDRRFADFDARRDNRRELTAILDRILRSDTTASWVRRLSAAGVPCAPVNDVAAALADPQTAARRLIVATEHDDFGTVRSVASPVRVGGSQVPHRRAPHLDEDAGYVLRDLLGYPESLIGSLTRAGAFGGTRGSGGDAPAEAGT